MRRFSLIVATVSVIAWLCGNAYEEIVIVPNFAVGDAYAAMLSFRAFFHLANPVFFYVPVGPAVIVGSLLSVMLSWSVPGKRRAATGVGACVLAAAALTVWIVVHVNLRLFLGPVSLDAAEAQSLGRQWLVLNALRVVLASSALMFLRRLA